MFAPLALIDVSLTLALDWGRIGTGLLFAAFLFSCVLLILAVLIQKPQGGGLAGAFGAGAGSGQTAFGTRTGDALTWATIIMFVLFILAAVGLTFAMRPSVGPPPGTDVSTPADKAGEKPPAADVVTPPAKAPVTPTTNPPTTPPSAPSKPPVPPFDSPATPSPAPSKAPGGDTPPNPAPKAPTPGR